MSQLIAVGLGGFIGACMRFSITKLMNRYFQYLPFGTLLSNMLAGFLIGTIIGMQRQATASSEHLHLFLVVGILGGLSTFSAFSIETICFMEKAQYLKAGLNVLLNTGLSFTLVVVGLLLAKHL